MKKSNFYKLFVFTIIFILSILTFPLKVNAADENSILNKPRVVDEASLLSSSEKTDLTNKVNKISEENKCDVVIVTVNSLGDKTAKEFADDYFDYNGYGYGNTRDGILLLISMEDRDWAISTSGYGITAFTDAGQEYIIDNIKSYLSSGNYYKAFDEFSNYCNSFIKEAKAGKPYDNNHRPKAKLSPLWIPLSIGIGAVISLIITLTMKKSLTSVKMERTANNYVDSGSINVTNCNDMFLYKNITRTAKPKNNTRRRGSSTHRSSSGRTHGGRSGKF